MHCDTPQVSVAPYILDSLRYFVILFWSHASGGVHTPTQDRLLASIRQRACDRRDVGNAVLLLLRLLLHELCGQVQVEQQRMRYVVVLTAAAAG